MVLRKLAAWSRGIGWSCRQELGRSPTMAVSGVRRSWDSADSRALRRRSDSIAHEGVLRHLDVVHALQGQRDLGGEGLEQAVPAPARR